MIRLVTVIGHGVELLPHFISHYTKYVDEICIVTYNSDLHPNIDDEVRAITDNLFNVKIVGTTRHRIFDWEEVTKLYNQATSKYGDD